MIFVNFKLYEKTFGDFTLELARICFEVEAETGIRVVPIVSSFFAKEIFLKFGKKAWLGHIDMFAEGKKTGYISPVLAQKLGVGGSLLNHSEHPLKIGSIANCIAACPTGFETMICTKSFGQADNILKKIKVKYLAYEPSYLIGSKTSSIATDRIEVFEKIVESAKKRGSFVLAGAGIKGRSDVTAVIQAGGSGVLVSSQVVESTDPKAVLLDLVAGFKV